MDKPRFVAIKIERWGKKTMTKYFLTKEEAVEWLRNQGKKKDSKWFIGESKSRATRNE